MDENEDDGVVVVPPVSSSFTTTTTITPAPAPPPPTTTSSNDGQSDIVRKAEARRAKLQAKSNLRMKLVSGEITSLEEQDKKTTTTTTAAAAAATAATESSTNTNNVEEIDAATTTISSNNNEPEQQSLPSPQSLSTGENVNSNTTNNNNNNNIVMEPPPPKSKWELKWEKEAAAAQRKQVSDDLVNKLKVTESMYVESPKLRDYVPEKSIPDNLLSNPPTSAGIVLNSLAVGGGIFLSPSLVTCFLCLISGFYIGYLSVFALDQVPMYNLFLLAALLQTIVRVSLKALRIPEPRQPSLQKSFVSQIFGAVVPAGAKLTLSNIAFTFRAVRDALEDAFTFGVAFGTARSITIWSLEGNYQNINNNISSSTTSSVNDKNNGISSASDR
jgi:hypothetical protein